MNARLSYRQISGIASLVVASLVNLPLITLTNRANWLGTSGLPDAVFFLIRLGFHVSVAFFFVERNRNGLKTQPDQLGTLGRYGLNFLLFLLMTTVFVVIVYPWYPERPVFLVATTYFRTFFVWATALLIAKFLTILEQNRRMQSENEQLKHERLQAQLDGLRAQLNPHFLFNSLNTLSSLIREGSDQTQLYLTRLSQVLRYSLQVQDQALVPFSEELQFVMAYSFLLHTRFGSNLHILNELPAPQPWLIPPMSLQLLLENAVKHNIVSGASPLTIRLFTDPAKTSLVVSNKYQPKPVPAEGTGTGLPNLENRFRLLTGQSIQIFRSEHEFSVHLPLIPAT